MSMTTYTTAACNWVQDEISYEVDGNTMIMNEVMYSWNGKFSIYGSEWRDDVFCGVHQFEDGVWMAFSGDFSRESKDMWEAVARLVANLV